jgi:hypothetical protein
MLVRHQLHACGHFHANEVSPGSEGWPICVARPAAGGNAEKRLPIDLFRENRSEHRLVWLMNERHLWLSLKLQRHRNASMNGCPSLGQFCVQCDGGVEDFGHRAVLLGLTGEARECRFIEVRHLGAQGQRGPADAKSLTLLLQRNGGFG